MKVSRKAKFSIAVLFFIFLSISMSPLFSQESEGTFILKLKPFVSEIKLRKKVLKQLESGALEWGISGNQFVTTLANKRFLNFDFPYMTRYGTSKEIKLKPGKYNITCVGFNYKGGMSVDKVLKKGAFFNLDVLSFEIVENKITVLEILPIIEKSQTLLVKMYSPDLKVKVIEDDQVKIEKTISKKGENSISWDEYDGDLKFKK
ncbi:hypothetical protein [Aquimarina sp. SS2-1]|uniref:hypothetical protein n=1 Tax=Aquimarina besae TaxID=3342247 RepID=UPI00366DF90A